MFKLMRSKMKLLSGSCMCGSVRYEVGGEFRDVIACHCIECRKASGHYTAATSVRPEKLKLLEDKGLAWFRSSPYAQRGFCRECGSTLFWKPDSGDRISVFVGTVDGPVDLPLTSHIYLAEKGNTFDLCVFLYLA
ncbi:MAG: hypothetical protein ACI9WS_002133 [Paraglaciecola psychrophila]|jgi:hypothetical protein